MKEEQAEKYILATGAEGDHRLKIVNEVHGKDSFMLTMGRASIRAPMRVADIGCGVGMMTLVLAMTVKKGGSVVGVDISAGQIEQVRRRIKKMKLSNVEFVTASAYETGLPPDSFDAVYSRFLLMHLARPADALAEMHRILKPGGTLAIEDGDFTAPFCWPPSAAYDRCFELYRLAGERQGADFRIGMKLFNLVQDAGFGEISVSLAQPILAKGDAKRLPEWTLAECAPSLLAANIATQDEIETLTTELQSLAADNRTMFGMARMTQIIAKK